MNLTVSSRHDLDMLEDWVVNKFSPIENKGVVLPDLGLPTPYPMENLGKLVKFVPVKD
jgi:secreted Zn-dependent insulinase-like peptidase